MSEENKPEEIAEVQLNEDGLLPGQDVDFETMQRIFKRPQSEPAKPEPKKK